MTVSSADAMLRRGGSALSLLALSIALTSCGSGGAGTIEPTDKRDQSSLSGAASSSQPQQVYQSDYPSYGSLDELFTRATAVVRGRVVGPARIATPTQPPAIAGQVSGSKESTAARDPLVYTVRTLRVTQVSKGDISPGDLIEVKQLGGILEGREYVEAGSRPLQQDRTYDVFLQTYPDEPASLLNPEQGQYLVAVDGSSESLPGNRLKVTAEDLRRLAADRE